MSVKKEKKDKKPEKATTNKRTDSLHPTSIIGPHTKDREVRNAECCITNHVSKILLRRNDG